MKHPTTEQGDLFGYQPETAVEPGMTRKLSHLRQKLGQKAKQEPQFLFYTLRVERKAPPANAWGESLQESRMRENRTSGSMRGRDFTTPCSTQKRFLLLRDEADPPQEHPLIAFSINSL